MNRGTPTGATYKLDEKLRALFKNRAGDEFVLSDVKIDGRLVTGTTRGGKQVALRFDRVPLRGSGTPPEPEGVRNQTGVTVLSTLGTNGAVPANYDFLARAATAVKRENHEPNAILYSTRTEETLALLKATDDQPLTRPQVLQSVRELSTNQIRTT
jgi:hypothetical protein